MNRWTSLVVGLGMTASLLAASPVLSQTVTVRVGDPYEGTALDFRTAPRMVLIPDTRVYSISDNNFNNDLYRFGGYWYFVDDGNWYRSDSWRGPFVSIRSNTVPRDVWNVPTEYRTSWTTTTRDNTGRRYVTTRTVGERYRGTELTFRFQPRMARIPRTRVDYIRSDSDFDNDLYRYNNRWYYVENGDWYQASSWRGPYYYVRFGEVPLAVRTVPSRYRRSWVTASVDRDRWRYREAGRVGERYTGNVSFSLDGGQPRMAIIPNTDVYYLRGESDADLYRYRNSWYLVDDGNWYRADSWRGPFFRVRMGDVPSPVVRIPAGYRKTWTPVTD